MPHTIMPYLPKWMLKIPFALEPTDRLIVEAMNRGELVFTMNQALSEQIRKAGPWGDIHSGFCKGLALQWLSLRMECDDFTFDEYQVCHNPPWEATKLFNIYSDYFSVHGNSDVMMISLLQKANMFLLRKSEPLYFDAEGLAFELTHESGMSQISFIGEGGNHAVAAECVNGVYTFFDPNYGAFKLRGCSRFADWLEDFFHKTKYDKMFEFMNITFVGRFGAKFNSPNVVW